MKFKAGQITEREWAVLKGTKRFYKHTLTTDKAQAERSAAAMSARWYIEQAAKLVNQMDLQDAKDIGHVGNDIIDAVTERCEHEDPNWCSTDPRGWTC